MTKIDLDKLELPTRIRLRLILQAYNREIERIEERQLGEIKNWQEDGVPRPHQLTTFLIRAGRRVRTLRTERDEKTIEAREHFSDGWPL